MMPNPYIIGGVGLLVALMAWRLLAAHERIGELEAKLETQAAETIEAADANDSNVVTISTLENRIRVMVEERRADIQQRERVLDDRDQELAAVRTEAEILRRERESAFIENPDCEDLASLDIAFFCPAVGRELRERSRGQGSN